MDKFSQWQTPILHHQIHDIIGSSLWTCKYLISYLITRPIRYTSNTCWISFPLALYILIECVSSSYWANDGGRRVHWWRQTIKSLTSHIYKWSTAPFTNSSWYSLSDTMINILCYILTVGLMPVDSHNKTMWEQKQLSELGRKSERKRGWGERS